MNLSERVEFHCLALEELRNARDWYDARSADVGRRFRQAVGRAVDRIAADWEALPVVLGHYRYCRLVRFPYIIVARRGLSL